MRFLRRSPAEFPTENDQPAPAMPCCFCDLPGDHSPDECPAVFTPIADCEHKDADDGCCAHPKNFTPECHANACPRIHPRLREIFNADMDAREGKA